MQQEQPELKPYPPKVVGSVTTLEDWISLANSDLSNECDWIELRLDTFPPHITAAELMENKPSLPILVTARCQEEGGKRAMTNHDRFELLNSFLPYAHAIDVEIACMDQAAGLLQEARKTNTLIIASGHDFNQTPELSTLLSMKDKAIKHNADIVKFAFMLNEPSDIMTGINFLEQADTPCAVMGMGTLGQTSRVLYSQLGSCLIYGYLGSYEAAPGQWPAREFKRTLNLLQGFSH